MTRSIILALIVLLPQFSFGQERTYFFMEFAKSEIQNKEYPKALVHLDSAAALSPQNADIDMLRADIYKLEEKSRKAIQSYTNAIGKKPGLARAYYERSILRYNIGDHRNYFIPDINSAIKSDPGNTKYYVQKAIYLSNTINPISGIPDHLEAIDVLSTAISIAPDSARFYDLRGQNKLDLNQNLAAIIDFSNAIQLDPENARYFGDRGLVKFIIEDYAGAIEDYTLAIDHDPLNEDYIKKRGHAKFNSGDYNSAIDDFTLAINTIYRKISLIGDQIVPSHPLNKNLRSNYLLRGSALYQVEYTYEACLDFKAARELGSRKAANYVRRYCH